MRGFFLIVFCLICQVALGCKCSQSTFMDLVARNDFVASAKIVNVEPDSLNTDFHNLEIEIIDLYKGEALHSIKLLSLENSSCRMMVDVGSTWLIFADNFYGDLSFGRCSGSFEMFDVVDEKEYPGTALLYQQSVDRKLEVLHYLKEQSIYVTDDQMLFLNLPSNALKDISTKYLVDFDFAIYRMKVSRNLSFDELRVVKDFQDASAGSQVFQALEKNLQISVLNNDQIPEPVNRVFCVYRFHDNIRGASYFTMYFP